MYFKNEGTELVTMVTTMLPVLGILLSLPAMDVLEHFSLTRININWEGALGFCGRR